MLVKHRAVRGFQFEGASQVRSYVLNLRAHKASDNFAGFHDLIHHLASHGHRDRKANALVAAATTRENRGVDADQIRHWY